MQWHTSKVQEIEDSKRFESSLAGTGPGSIAETVPRLLNALAGTRFKLVSGYPASNEAMLAMERGEVEGASSSWAAVSVAKKDCCARTRSGSSCRPHRNEPPSSPTRRRCPNSAPRPRTNRSTSSTPAAARSGARSSPRPDCLRTARRLCAPRSRPWSGCGLHRRHPETNVELDPLPGEKVQELIVRTLNVPAAVRERAKLAFGGSWS